MTKASLLCKDQALPVGFHLRLAAALFGAPSVGRAVGRAQATFMPHWFQGRWWQRRRSATPVYALDCSKYKELPRIWLSEPYFDGTQDSEDGRIFTAVYPNGYDRDGARAYELAETLFAEALAYPEQSSSQGRDCYRACEILYLHSARKGSSKALVRLGVIYRDNLCAGRYWGLEDEGLGSPHPRCPHYCSALQLQRWAIRCFQEAADRGSAEAWCYLGDLFAAIGGKALTNQAYECYTQSYRMAEPQSCDHGIAALRLGHCAERAWGCSLSFSDALCWYEQAVEVLEHGFEQGQWHYKRFMHEAREGVGRMEQELLGNC